MKISTSWKWPAMPHHPWESPCSRLRSQLQLLGRLPDGHTCVSALLSFCKQCRKTSERLEELVNRRYHRVQRSRKPVKVAKVSARPPGYKGSQRRLPQQALPRSRQSNRAPTAVLPRFTQIFTSDLL